MRCSVALWVSLLAAGCAPGDADTDKDTTGDTDSSTDTDTTADTDGTSDTDEPGETDTTSDTDETDVTAASLCAPSATVDHVHTVELAVSTAGGASVNETGTGKEAELLIFPSAGFDAAPESSHWLILEFDRTISFPEFAGQIQFGYYDLPIGTSAMGVADGTQTGTAGIRRGQVANVVPPVQGGNAWLTVPQGTTFSCVGIGWTEGPQEGDNQLNFAPELVLQVNCPLSANCDDAMIVVGE